MYTKNAKITLLRILWCVCLSVALTSTPVYAAKVSETDCMLAAQHFIADIDPTVSLGEWAAVRGDNGNIIGYRFTLSTGGFLLISADTDLTPVKSYSLTSPWDNIPPVHKTFLQKELVVPDSKKKTSEKLDSTNRGRWETLLRPSTKTISKAAAVDPILSTTWNQGSPYNTETPIVDGAHTWAGCTQTAIAQIMKHHNHPPRGQGVFTHTWNGQTMVADMNRPFNWNILPDAVTPASAPHIQAEVGYLLRDIGIINGANYGLSGTSAWFNTAEFAKAFGYGTDIQYMNDSNYDAFINAIINDIDQGLPVFVSLPNHATVADGYNKSAAGTAIHINMGWGGSSDAYYYLDTTFTAGSHTYEPDHVILYNIKPCIGSTCASPTLSQQGRAPVITDGLYNASIATPLTYRIATQDMDGDTVELSAQSSNDDLGISINGNLLTITPSNQTSYSLVRVKASSNGGIATQDIGILSTSPPIACGSDPEVTGTFTNNSEIHSFQMYLDGEVTISGDRGYSNQAFYIWVKDAQGRYIVSSQGDSFTHTFPAGIYTVFASLRNDSTGSWYSYNPSFADFKITAQGSKGTVQDLAVALGLDPTGSSPVTDDTDEDGLADSWEQTHFGNLNQTAEGDYDGDGLTNIQELNAETSPTNTDTDGDGMPDKWEVDNNLNPNADDAGLDKDGDGANNFQELISNTNPNDSASLPDADSSESQRIISANRSNSLYIKTDGTLWAWGDDWSGLGTGSNMKSHIPVQIGNDYKTIAAGSLHFLGLKNDGTLWTWGDDWLGALGDGPVSSIRSTPVQIGSGYKDIAAGEFYSLGLKSDGTLWAWGYNEYGQLGDGTTTNRHTPVQIGSGYNSIAAGGRHSLGLKSDGTLWAWGYNVCGQLGDGTTTNRHTPVQIGSGYKAIAAGWLHSLGLKSDGTLWTWGYNGCGQLGDGTTTNRQTPVQIGSGYKSIAAGGYYSLGLKYNETLWTWGDNDCGQLGGGTTTYRQTPEQVDSGYKTIAAGGRHSLGLKSDGTLWTWGYNGGGQLGDGTTTNRQTPVQIFINEDFDNDSLTDFWEQTYFGNLNQTAEGDYDGDGVSNYDEFLEKTDPTDPNDFPKGSTKTIAATIHINENVTSLVVYVNDKPCVTTFTDTGDGNYSIKYTLPYGVSPEESFYLKINDEHIGELNSTTFTDDTDGDNLTDSWEQAYFGNLDQTAEGDFDNDGVNNYDEFLENTNPTDSKDFPIGAILTITPTIKVGEEVTSIIVYVNNKPCVTTFTNTGDGKFSVNYTLPYGTDPAEDFYLKVNDKYVGELNSLNIVNEQKKTNMAPVHHLLFSQNSPQSVH